jgi:transcriptional/translational regulatory protein YebC/TACO1
MGRAYQNRKESMAKTSDAKAKVYSKYGREIYVCAKSGGLDPDGNLSLRSMIDRAKKDQVPSHVIEKALEKAKGGSGEDFSTARYEGFGPGNSMVIVDCLTDNPNRTFGDVRSCFTKTKCKIGTQGSVSHMLEADVDVSDIENEDGKISIFAPHTDYFKAKQALNEAFGKKIAGRSDKEVDFEVDEIQFIPQSSNPISSVDAETFDIFLAMLNDLDDVQNIYHNAEYS